MGKIKKTWHPEGMRVGGGFYILFLLFFLRCEIMFKRGWEAASREGQGANPAVRRTAGGAKSLGRGASRETTKVRSHRYRE